MIMQAGPTARHSPIGSFGVPATQSVLRRPTARMLQRPVNPGGTTAPPPAITSAGTQQRMTPLAHGSDQVTCVCSCRRAWVRWRSLAASNPLRAWRLVACQATSALAGQRPHG